MAQKTVLQVQLADMVQQFRATRDAVKNLRGLVKAERVANRDAKAKATAERKATAAQRKVAAVAKVEARIAKAQAKLEALRAKAQTPKAKKKAARKASPVTVLVQNGRAVAA